MELDDLPHQKEFALDMLGPTNTENRKLYAETV
jgi:hypothetical protein